MAKKPLRVTSVNTPDPSIAIAVLDLLRVGDPQHSDGDASSSQASATLKVSDDDFDDCLIDFEVTLGATYGEPSEFVCKYEGTIRSGADFEDQVGKIELYVADLEGAAFSSAWPTWEVLDSVNAGLAQFCDLVSVKSGEFKPAVQKIAQVELCRLLIIDRLELESQFRGRGLGLKAIEVVCERMSSISGCGLAALRAFPLQWEGRAQNTPPQFRRDQAKLVGYYSRAGFQRVLGNALMIRSLLD